MLRDPIGQNPNATAREPRTRAAFTLLEIILAVALIALLAGVLVTGATHLLGDKPATAEEVFWKAVGEARKTALLTEREVRMTFDSKDSKFLLFDGVATQSFATPPIKNLTVNFLSAQNGPSLVLIGGEAVESQTIPAVTFFTDGTCTPFRIQFRKGGPAHVLAIDPWTCAAVLPRTDNAP